VRDHNGGNAQTPLEGAYFAAHVGSHLGVQGGKRFVQEKQDRFDGEGAGKSHALLLAARQLGRKFPRAFLQPHQGQEFSGPAPGVTAAPASPPDSEGDIAQGVEVGKKGVGLEDDADAPPRDGNAGDVPPVDADGASIGLLQAGDNAEKGCFPATRRAENADEFAFADRQGHLPERQAGAERLADARRLEAGRCRRPGSGSFNGIRFCRHSAGSIRQGCGRVQARHRRDRS
jgi:hypothetical protein